MERAGESSLGGLIVDGGGSAKTVGQFAVGSNNPRSNVRAFVLLRSQAHELLQISFAVRLPGSYQCAFILLIVARELMYVTNQRKRFMVKQFGLGESRDGSRISTSAFGSQQSFMRGSYSTTSLGHPVGLILKCSYPPCQFSVEADNVVGGQLIIVGRQLDHSHGPAQSIPKAQSSSVQSRAMPVPGPSTAVSRGISRAPQPQSQPTIGNTAPKVRRAEVARKSVAHLASTKKASPPKSQTTALASGPPRSKGKRPARLKSKTARTGLQQSDYSEDGDLGTKTAAVTSTPSSSTLKGKRRAIDEDSDTTDTTDKSELELLSLPSAKPAKRSKNMSAHARPQTAWDGNRDWGKQSYRGKTSS